MKAGPIPDKQGIIPIAAVGGDHGSAAVVDIGSHVVDEQYISAPQVVTDINRNAFPGFLPEDEFRNGWKIDKLPITDDGYLVL
jgi:hypothetical protein